MSIATFATPVVQTEMYDGPLDLLLHLVQRDGIDLCQLPLVHITREYLAALGAMQVVDLDIAGEFLVMAATLCELKSRELLPGAPPMEQADEEDDPREALIRRIIRYQRYRQAAEELRRGLQLDRDVFVRPPQRLDLEERPVEPGIDAIELCELYQRARRDAAKPPPVHEVEREPLHWRDTLVRVLETLDGGQEHPLDGLLATLPSRPARIMAFLAVLELVRIRAVSVHQREHLAPVLLRGLLRADEVQLEHIPEAM
jgi:segregation and condensation protein A